MQTFLPNTSLKCVLGTHALPRTVAQCSPQWGGASHVLAPAADQSPGRRPVMGQGISRQGAELHMATHCTHTQMESRQAHRRTHRQTHTQARTHTHTHTCTRTHGQASRGTRMSPHTCRQAGRQTRTKAETNVLVEGS